MTIEKLPRISEEIFISFFLIWFIAVPENDHNRNKNWQNELNDKKN